MSKFDFLVFIGRFQPFHCGHLAVVNQALQQSSQVIILLGSAHVPATTRDPFSVKQREAMIRANFNEADNARLHLMPLIDVLYNDAAWVRNVQKTVEGIVTAFYPHSHQAARIGLIGHCKDHSSYYLNRFPQWQAVEVANYRQLSATPLRQAFFSEESLDEAHCTELLNQWQQQQWVSPQVSKVLAEYAGSQAHQHIIGENAFVKHYQAAWQSAPYAPTFVTVDAVVIQSGHILLIERRARPGKGLYALPGGFLDAEESLFDACLRELREETKLKVPQPVLRGSCLRQKVYDTPYRSARGRTLTHAFLFELNPSHDLPKVKGGDDAKSAFWLPIADLHLGQLFEDHYFIIQDLLGVSE